MGCTCKGQSSVSAHITQPREAHAAAGRCVILECVAGARIVIPGGSGYLGGALTERLVARGDEVVILTRGRGESGEGWRAVTWDARTPTGPWAAELEGADAIVHLSGRRVDTRATRRNIDELISSRVGPVRVVGEALRACKTPPPVWVQSSSLAIFGEGGDEVIDESKVPSGI